MAEPDIARSIESLPEVVEILQRALVQASGLIARNDPICYPTAENCAQFVPDSEGKGAVVQNEIAALEGMAISGLNPQEAVEQALTELLGPRQSITWKSYQEGLYVVGCGHFDIPADRSPPKPRLWVGKIDRNDDIWRCMQKMAQHMLQPDLAKAFTARELAGARDLLEKSERVLADIEKRGQADVGIWTHGRLESLACPVFGVGSPAPDERYHVMEIPFKPQAFPEASRDGLAEQMRSQINGV